MVQSAVIAIILIFASLASAQAKLGMDFVSDLGRSYGDILSMDAETYQKQQSEKNPKLLEFRKEVLAFVLTSQVTITKFSDNYKPPTEFYTPLMQQMLLELAAAGLKSPNLGDRCLLVTKSTQLLALTTPYDRKSTLGFNLDDSLLLLTLLHFGFDLAKDVDHAVLESARKIGSNGDFGQILRNAANDRTPALPCVNMQSRDKETNAALDFLMKRFTVSSQEFAQAFPMPDARYIKSGFGIFTKYELGSKGIYNLATMTNPNHRIIVVQKSPRDAGKVIPSFSFYYFEVDKDNNLQNHSNLVIDTFSRPWTEILGVVP